MKFQNRMSTFCFQLIHFTNLFEVEPVADFCYKHRCGYGKLYHCVCDRVAYNSYLPSLEFNLQQKSGWLLTRG